MTLVPAGARKRKSVRSVAKSGGQGTPAQAEAMVKKGRGPKGIKRIDRPELSVPSSQYHAHAYNNAALNLDGTIHDKHRGMPPFSKDDRDFFILLWLERCINELLETIKYFSKKRKVLSRR